MKSLTPQKVIIYLLLCSPCLAFGQGGPGAKAQKNPAVQAKPGSMLTNFIASHPVEKAYLQFDKPYYAAGDTIYFKAYVTLGEDHKLSDLSGVLHADLINTKNKVDRSIQLKLDSGMAWGDFALPDSLQQGNYRVRAYTQWMRNEADPRFFEKTITVAALKPPRLPEAVARHQRQDNRPDVQFFPEGGNLVAGLPAKIAFKAAGPDGLGTAVKGVVTDDSGTQVVSFTSGHLGMGYFYLAPAEGKSYSAKVTYPDGRQDVVRLPTPAVEGISLSVDNDSLPKAVVKVIANQSYYSNNRGKTYSLVISSGGLVATMSCALDSPVIKADVLKRKFRSGIATVTLFSPENEPLCERLFFIQNYDQLSLELKGDKAAYAERETVKMQLNALNRRGEAAAGHFSVSVVDEVKAPDADTSAENILSGLLLTSDLKGYVEQPGYYFSDTSAQIRKDLDVLMLTQGYRRFEWKQVLDSVTRQPVYGPEKGIIIAGQVNNVFNNPVANGTVTLLPVSGGQLLTAVTDTSGNFRFTNLSFTDTGHFVLGAVNKNNKNSTQLRLISDVLPVQPVSQFTRAVPDSVLAGYVAKDEVEQQATLNYLNSKGIMLKQVNIRDRKPDDQYQTQSLAGSGHADQVMHAEEIGQIQGGLITSLNGRLRGVVFTATNKSSHVMPYLAMNLYGSMAPKPMLVIIDGTEGGSVNSLTASEVETVEVLKYASASMYGMQGGNGVLIITTKQGGGVNPKNVISSGVLPISPAGFYKAREFYSPKYDHISTGNKYPDLRSTIWWQPELKTDANGDATFEYNNADGKGIYRVTVEGIDKDGNIGRVVYRYRVE